MDQRRTDSGHVSLIVTDLCASGIDQVRTCKEGEKPGVVITTYANLASDYNKSIFVLPVLDHFTATSNPALIPVLSSGASLRAAQIEYWREHLRPYLPPMAQERYNALREEMERFDAGRTFRRFLTMEFIGSLLAGHKQEDPTEPIAITDPATKELIPDGRWREAVGTEQLRSAVVLTAPSSLTQELRLVRYLRERESMPFNALSGNCSDMVKGALLAVYGDAGLHFRPRIADVADAWITSPLFVATGFVSYAKKNGIPLSVSFLPITAGTRRSHFSVHSISRGALVPEPSQGKLAFSLKTYINVLNPLLGGTAFAVDQISTYVDLPRLIHDCSEGDLFNIDEGSQGCRGESGGERERVRIFGTVSCWKNKENQFQHLTSQAAEVGLLSRREEDLLLKLDQPFLLPRLYEHPAYEKDQKHTLDSKMRSCFMPGCQAVGSLQKVSLPVQPTLDRIIPGRPEIRMMADSSEQTRRKIAFMLMTSVINYDLSSDPMDRKGVQAFDKDWTLFLYVAERNHLTLPSVAAAGETLEACSCQSFDTGAEQKDALQIARGFPQRMIRAERELVTAPTR